MTPEEFRSLQGEIGCTGARLAEWLGVSPLTVTRWRQGHTSIPGPVEFVMKALATGYRP